jgi:hypothetical protein
MLAFVSGWYCGLGVNGDYRPVLVLLQRRKPETRKAGPGVGIPTYPDRLQSLATEGRPTHACRRQSSRVPTPQTAGGQNFQTSTYQRIRLLLPLRLLARATGSYVRSRCPPTTDLFCLFLPLLRSATTREHRTQPDGSPAHFECGPAVAWRHCWAGGFGQCQCPATAAWPVPAYFW